MFCIVTCRGGERGYDSAFPKPTTGAVLVTADGRILGKGRSNYKRGCVQGAIADAGIKATPLKEWCVDWVSDPKLREDIAGSTLYVTLEPSPVDKGEEMPSITKLIEQAGIPNVVIGCPYPVPELAYKGAAALHRAGLSVRVLQATDELHQECVELIPEFTALSNSKVSQASSYFVLVVIELNDVLFLRLPLTICVYCDRLSSSIDQKSRQETIRHVQKTFRISSL